jgi:hypothetical protein
MWPPSGLNVFILLWCTSAWLKFRAGHALALNFELYILSENRVLSRIFRAKREEVAGGWRRLHNEELHNLCTSLNNVEVIKSGDWDGRRLWRAWVRWKAHTGVRSGSLKGGDHSEDLGVDGRMILELILGKSENLDGSVGIATFYGLDDLMVGIWFPAGMGILLFYTMSRPALRFT